MEEVRAELDADRIEWQRNISEIETAANPHELFCGMCNRTLFVDDTTLESVNRAVQTGLDNPLLCNDCRQEYEELAHEGR